MIFHLKLSGSHAHSTLKRTRSAALLIMMIGLFPLFSSNMLAVFLVLLTSIVSHPLFPLSASVFTLSSGVPVAKAWTLLVPVGAALTTTWFLQSFLSRVR